MMMGITYWTLMNSAAGTWCAGATTGTARGRTPGTAMLTCCWRWLTLQRRCRHDPLLAIAGGPALGGLAAPGGGMNISFEVPGQPAPWGVYRRRRRGQRSSPGKDRMEAYQDTIRLYARQKWGPEPPFMGPVKIAVVVYPDVGKTLRGDAINYGKAVEDATQGIVIGNDRQTVEIRATKGKNRGA